MFENVIFLSYDFLSLAYFGIRRLEEWGTQRESDSQVIV